MNKDTSTELGMLVKRMEDIVTSTTNGIVVPVRKNLLARFPITTVLIVTFGVTAVTYGAERLYQEIEILNEHPLVLLISGLAALMITGKLYQKLG